MDQPVTSTAEAVDTALATHQVALTTLRQTIASIYRGDGRSIDLVLTALLAGGHVLLEDIPGVGKTTLARTLAAAIDGAFRRLQCTPDLMPSDVTGVSIYDEHERRFRFHPGPVFANILLADELNRTPPRTQSALLEAMSERQVTVEGEARDLPKPFMCIATQNPLDHAGTYPLPESQQDRFLLSLGLGYPERDSERDLLVNDGADDDLAKLEPCIDLATIDAMQRLRPQVRVAETVQGYILDLVAASRNAKSLHLGASPRAAIGLQRAAQAWAILAGRTFVIPEDIQTLAPPALAHRVSPRAGQDPQLVIQGLVESIAVPR